MSAHLWAHRYRFPVPQGEVIHQHRPGEQLALAITEIQETVITDVSSPDGSINVGRNGGAVELSAATVGGGGGGAAPDERTIITDADGLLSLMERDTALPGQVFCRKADGTYGFDFVRAV